MKFYQKKGLNFTYLSEDWDFKKDLLSIDKIIQNILKDVLNDRVKCEIEFHKNNKSIEVLDIPNQYRYQDRVML